MRPTRRRVNERRNGLVIGHQILVEDADGFHLKLFDEQERGALVLDYADLQRGLPQHLRDLVDLHIGHRIIGRYPAELESRRGVLNHRFRKIIALPKRVVRH